MRDFHTQCQPTKRHGNISGCRALIAFGFSLGHKSVLSLLQRADKIPLAYLKTELYCYALPVTPTFARFSFQGEAKRGHRVQIGGVRAFRLRPDAQKFRTNARFFVYSYRQTKL